MGRAGIGPAVVGGAGWAESGGDDEAGGVLGGVAGEVG
jgi:hypothetical protein